MMIAHLIALILINIRQVKQMENVIVQLANGEILHNPTLIALLHAQVIQ